MEAVTLASILADVTTIVTSAFGWVGTAVTTVTGSPLLMIFAVISLVGLGIGLLSRLMNIR